MNTNTNKWGVEVGGPEISEAIQRIAFSFGYRWAMDRNSLRNEVRNVNGQVLVFNPDEKEITFCASRQSADRYVCKMIRIISEVVEMFKTPPVEAKEWQVSSNGHTVHKDGSVLFKNTTESVAVSSPAMDEVINLRNKFIGKLEEKKEVKYVRMASKVTFVYRSQNSLKKARTVLVLKADENGMDGLDVHDHLKYKRFLYKNVLGNIVFIGFQEAPEK